MLLYFQHVPWVPEVFSRVRREPRFVGRRPTRVWPKAEDTSREDLTETGNLARKASDTQGKITHVLVTKRHKLAIEKEGAGALQEIPQVLY